MEVLPPSGTSCVRQWLIIYRSQRCPDVFTKRFGFGFFSYLFLFAMHFTSCVLNDHTSTHLHAVMGCITCLFLAASGAAGSREANLKGVLGVWDSSGCLWHSSVTCWDVAYLSLHNLMCERRKWWAPQAIRTGWGMSQPAPVISSAAAPEWLWHFWNHLQIDTGFNGTYMCAEVFCFSAKVLSTLYFSHVFFFPVQELNNALCFPVV